MFKDYLNCCSKKTNNFDSTEQFWYILTHTYRIWLVKPYLCNIPCARMTCDASIQIMTNSPICFWSESCSRCNYWGIIQSNSVLLKRTSMGCLLSTNWCRISQLSTVYRTSRYTRGESPLKSHAWLHQEGKNRSIQSKGYIFWQHWRQLSLCACHFLWCVLSKWSFFIGNLDDFGDSPADLSVPVGRRQQFGSNLEWENSHLTGIDQKWCFVWKAGSSSLPKWCWWVAQILIFAF